MKNTLKLFALAAVLTTGFTDVNAGRELTPQEAEEITVLKGGTIIQLEDNFLGYDWLNSDAETVVAKFIEFTKDLDAENLVILLKKLRDQGRDFPKTDKDHFGNAFKSLYMYKNGIVNPNGMKLLDELANHFGPILTAKATATAKLGDTPIEKKWFKHLAKQLRKLENQLTDAWSNTFGYEGPGFHDKDQAGAAAAAAATATAAAALPSYDDVTNDNS